MTGHMVEEIDPLIDARWPPFVESQPAASVFHSRGWLEALHRTYGYSPAVVTTSQPGKDLANGLVFCRVSSWLTGRRIVALPFSDHCEPLVRNTEDLHCLARSLQEKAKAERCKYAELRPISPVEGAQIDYCLSQTFYLHRLDLRPGPTEVFRRFHHDCIQRKILRAEREGIVVRSARSDEFVRAFYQLVLQTRGRQGLPPQPLLWYRNLTATLGESANIQLAYKGNRVIAGILTLQHGKRLFYKYGASEAASHRLGAMPYLFWKAIEGALDRGLEELDMGRSDCDATGLVVFKDRWNATRSLISYWRSPASSARPVTHTRWRDRLARRACSLIPETCLASLGTLLYRHFA